MKVKIQNVTYYVIRQKLSIVFIKCTCDFRRVDI